MSLQVLQASDTAEIERKRKKSEGQKTKEEDTS